MQRTEQQAAWKSYRLLKGIWGGLFVAFLPLVGILYLWLGDTRLLNGLVTGYGLIFAGVSAKMLSWPCPRCDVSFMGGCFKIGSIADLALSNRRCKNCGLLENSPSWTELR